MIINARELRNDMQNEEQRALSDERAKAFEVSLRKCRQAPGICMLEMAQIIKDTLKPDEFTLLLDDLNAIDDIPASPERDFMKSTEDAGVIDDDSNIIPIRIIDPDEKN